MITLNKLLDMVRTDTARLTSSGTGLPMKENTVYVSRAGV